MVRAQAVQRRITAEQQHAVRRRVLLLDPEHRRRTVRLGGQRSKDRAIGERRRRTAAGGDRCIEHGGRRGIPGRVPDSQSELVRSAGVAKEAHRTHVLARRWLAGGLARPRPKGRAARTDLDRDVHDAGEAIAARPVKVQGAALASVDPDARRGGLDVI